MLHYILEDVHIQWHPPLIRHYTNFFLPFYWSGPNWIFTYFFLVEDPVRPSVHLSFRRPSVGNLNTFSTSSLQPLNEINETWLWARSQRPLPSLCFSGRLEKQDGNPCLWFAETFLHSPLKTLNGIRRNLTGGKIVTSSTKCVFFGLIGNTRWPSWPLIGRYILEFSSETAERNSTKLDRKQDLNGIYHVCVFRADRKKTRWPPRSLIGWDFFDFVSETAERNSTKLDRKQDHNVLYQVCVFSADRKTRWPPWPLIGWDIFDFFSETAEQNSTTLDRKKKISTSSSKFEFFRPMSKQKCRPGQSVKKVAHCTQVHDMRPFDLLFKHLRGPVSKHRALCCVKVESVKI